MEITKCYLIPIKQMSADSLTEITIEDWQKFIQALLDVNRFSRRELGDRLGTSHGAVNNWLIPDGSARSKIKPSREILEKLAEMMNMPLWRVMRMVQEREIPEPLQDRTLVSIGAIKALAGATEKEIDALAAQMEELPTDERFAAISKLSNALMRPTNQN
jgi:transcriptional regulator with XRE-family HTH domain